jgi:hypothetical protein
MTAVCDQLINRTCEFMVIVDDEFSDDCKSATLEFGKSTQLSSMVVIWNTINETAQVPSALDIVHLIRFDVTISCNPTKMNE